jgi:hypothetical protein
MRLLHRHRARNITIGSLLTAASIGAAVYMVYRYTRDIDWEENSSSYDGKDGKVIDSAEDVLVSKIGASESEVEEAKLLDLTAYDLAKDKGFSEEQLKMFINQERTRPIDELILNRKITSEVGEQVKEKIVEHTNSWDGRLC